MRNRPQSKPPSWKAFVLEGRTAAGLSQRALAAAIDVDRTTVWRWENEDRKPESAELALKVARILRASREIALTAAGFVVVDQDAETDPRLEGLDPEDPAVRYIMDLDVDEKFRDDMLDRLRENVARDRQRRLEEIEFWARRRGTGAA